MIYVWVGGPGSPRCGLAAANQEHTTLFIVPSGSISLTQPFPPSATSRAPVGSTKRPKGIFSSEFVAGPPSPDRPASPVPAKVEMIP